MKKAIVGIVLGTVVYFAWGAAAWMALPFHEKSMKALPAEQLIVNTLKTVVLENGFYAFPAHKTENGPLPDSEFKEKYEIGPVGALVFLPHGRSFMGPQSYGVSVATSFLISCIVMLVLWASRGVIQSALLRMVFMSVIGLGVWLAALLPLWTWFGFPCAFVFPYILDFTVGFGLLGLIQSPFVPE